MHPPQPTTHTELRIHPSSMTIVDEKLRLPTGEIDVRRLMFSTPTMSVSVGPFTDDQWHEFVASLGNPEAEAERQQARSRIIKPGMAASLKAVPRSRLH